MRVLSLLIISILLFLASRKSDSPHGSDFKISCSKCHSSTSWELDQKIYSFDHNSTKLPLIGQHIGINCRLCHPTLVFSEAGTECVDCHIDIHQATVGQDCARCHTPSSWLVSNITEIHQNSRFPLLGAHKTADCFDCHYSENLTRFDINGISCIDCHRDDYLSTTLPNHVSAGFSDDCSGCHSINAARWEGAGFNHAFFPLQQSHAIACAECHTGDSYSGLSRACSSCHQADFIATTNPDHEQLGFPETCNLCHTLTPDWKPASYRQHDSESFPIYSGEHNGEWNACTDCHTNTGNYNVFSCLNCHEHNKTDMDDKHLGEVKGYSYISTECLRCHPNGEED